MSKTPTKGKAVRCLIDVGRIPIEWFRLPKDRGYNAARARQLVLNRIAERANPDGTGSFPSDKYLAERTRYTLKYIQQLRYELRTLGFLKWNADKTTGRGNAYTITPAPWLAFSKADHPAGRELDHPADKTSGQDGHPVPEQDGYPAGRGADHPADKTQGADFAAVPAENRKYEAPTVPLPSQLPPRDENPGGGNSEILNSDGKTTIQLFVKRLADAYNAARRRKLPITKTADYILRPLVTEHGEELTFQVWCHWHNSGRDFETLEHPEYIWSAFGKEFPEALDALRQQEREQERAKQAARRRLEDEWMDAYIAEPFETPEQHDAWIDAHPMPDVHKDFVASRREFFEMCEHAEDYNQLPDELTQVA